MLVTMFQAPRIPSYDVQCTFDFLDLCCCSSAHVGVADSNLASVQPRTYRRQGGEGYAAVVSDLPRDPRGVAASCAASSRAGRAAGGLSAAGYSRSVTDYLLLDPSA